MRSSHRALWKGLAESRGRISPVYGAVMAVGIGVPLIVGLVTGRVGEGQLVALGAFYVGVGAPQGPYGSRLRAMLTAVAVVTVCTWLGGALSGHPWPAVIVVSIMAALGVAIPWVGTIASLCTLVAALRPETSPALFNGFLETIGGLWVSVLLLAPWMTHRLRPLRVSLSGAAEAVADALDCLSGEDHDGWYERRDAAYSALRSARSTYGLYLGGGRDQHERIERLIEAMRRAMDQAVALRSLMIAVQRRSPPDAWTRECRIAVGALAGRVRGLAGAIERRDGAVPEDSVQLDRLTRMTEDVRRDWLEGRTDVVATALAQQVRRTVRRIGATTDGMAEIIAHGLRLGVLAPRTPDRRWFKGAITVRSPEFRHAARVGAAIAFSVSLAFGLKLPHPHWLALPVLFTLRDSYGDTVSMVFQRIAGTVLGATAAAVALFVAPGQPTLIALILVGAAVGFTVKPSVPAYWIVLSTPMMMLLIDFSAPLTWVDAVWRIGLTLGGGVIAVVAARVLWPERTARTLPGTLSGLLYCHAEAARAVAARLEGDEDAPVRARVAEAVEAADEVKEAADRLASEPVPPQDLVEQLREATEAARLVRDHLRTLEIFTHEEPPDIGPIPAILESAADYLDQGADTQEGPTPEPAFDDLCQELDQHLSDLDDRRREELARNTDTDAVTRLRTSLVDVAGARHAVQALIADTGRLRKAVQAAG